MKEKTQRNKQIFKKKCNGATDFELAKEYNLHPMTIRQIVTRERARLSVNQ